MTALRDYTPPDRIEDAVVTVARWVISRLCDPVDLAHLREDYPDLGEHDWVAVVERVHRTATINEPTAAQFERAYRLLAALAEGATP